MRFWYLSPHVEVLTETTTRNASGQERLAEKCIYAGTNHTKQIKQLESHSSELNDFEISLFKSAHPIFFDQFCTVPDIWS